MGLSNYPVPTSPVQAQPIFLVDANGNPISGSNTLSVNASVSVGSVGATGSAVPSQADYVGGINAGNLVGLLVDASGRLYVNVNSLPALPAGSNLVGVVELADSGGTNKLAIDASGRLSLVPNQVMEIGDGTTPTQKLAIDASGRLTLIPNSSVNAAQIGGQAPTLDNTTVLAVSMRGKSSTAGDTAILVDSTGRQLVGRSTTALYSLASASQTSSSNSGDLAVSAYTEIGLDINTTAQTGTNPTVQFFWERKGADGIYYILWQSSVLSVAANTLSTSIGAGMAYNQSLGSTGRFRWTIGGTNTPGYTFSVNIYAK